MNYDNLRESTGQMVLRQSFDNPIARRFTNMANKEDHLSDSSSSDTEQSFLEEVVFTEKQEIKNSIIDEEESEYMNTQEEILDDQIEEQKCIRFMMIIVIIFVWSLNSVCLYS